LLKQYYFVAVAFVIAALLILLTGDRVTGQVSDPRVPELKVSHVGDFVVVEGDVVPMPLSGIDISRAFLFTNPVNRLDPILECAFFTNTASRVATNVDLLFSEYREDGQHELDDTLDVQGTFSRGALIALQQVDFKVISGNCVVADGDKVARTSVTVIGVRYADGSVWHSVPMISGTDITNPAAPVKVTSVTAYAGVRPTPSKDPKRLPISECSDIFNSSTRNISYLRLIFRHFAADGSNLGDDTLSFRTNVLPNAPLKNNCLDLRAPTSPDLLHYAQALAQGKPDRAAPAIIYKGKPSTLSAFVDEVDFTDGTKWQAPAS
jgi:hypothetical protein